ncbi:uncharacterized protein LOC133716387 [Rosa rugosa]|uniref:uncharacterized protein LOC133716387 n=1 Tax=Rosa rugosa TaxID=74645 RepID=UPI002B40C88D|nr:uncharacterized protein LOC133716387 [Rosa rugosa]
MADASPKTPSTSYAAILSDNSPLNFVIDDLPTPFEEEGLVSIRISEEPFRRGMERCKTNLVGRVTAPIRTPDLVQQLRKCWSSLGEWTAAPLGRGFFMLQFKTLTDMQQVWSMGSLRLQTGMLRLIKWSPSFSPSTYRNTFGQVWVRFWDLGFAFWDHQTLFEIAAGIGTPLKLDPRTKNRTVGLYARILVDVDFSKTPPDKLRITRANGEVVVVGVELESVPHVCSRCGIIGHIAASCRSMSLEEERLADTVARGRSTERSGSKKRNARRSRRSRRPSAQATAEVRDRNIVQPSKLDDVPERGFEHVCDSEPFPSAMAADVAATGAQQHATLAIMHDPMMVQVPAVEPVIAHTTVQEAAVDLGAIE